MWAGGRVIGAVSFGKFRSGRAWPQELLDHLALSVRLFGSAIERKQSEMAIRAVRTELRVASRRNVMSELVASLSHEINQPLGAILSNLGGVARLLSQGNPQPAMALEAVNSAIDDTKRTAEIVRRIRSMFKNHVEHKTALGIGPLIDEVVKLTAGEAAATQNRGPGRGLVRRAASRRRLDPVAAMRPEPGHERLRRDRRLELRSTRRNRQGRARKDRMGGRERMR